METFNDKPISPKIHLIGIAGEGMTGLAQCLLDLQYQVSGSDSKDLAQLDFLVQLGIEVHSGHRIENITDADMVIYSDAISPSNIELTEARILNLPILSRAQSIKQLLTRDYSILVTGSHGKSTTSAMAATLLAAKGVDPSFLIGASAASLNFLRGYMGPGPYFVGEACEAFQNLIHFEPSIAVITNIDDEHLEHYGSQAQLDKAFIEFANRAQIGVIINEADLGTRRIRNDIKNNIITFGLNSSADVQARSIQYTKDGSSFDLHVKGNFIQRIDIPVPGIHIILNALAAISSIKMAGFSLQDIGNGLSQYRGVKRRWEWQSTGQHIKIIDDYAHHPTELRALRLAARSVMNAHERLLIAFQPQLFSRTKRLALEFARELSGFDEILLLEIHGGGEINSEGITSEIIIHELEQLNTSATLFASVEDLIEYASQHLKKHDFLCVAGTGSIAHAANRIAKTLRVQSLDLNHLHKPNKLNIASSLNPCALQIAFTNPIPEAYPGVLKFFYQHTALSPHAIAVSDGKESLSYYQLHQAANRIATYLSDQAISKGDIVAIQAIPSLELIALMLAIQKIGAVYLPLDINLPPKRRSYQLEVAGAKLWITSIAKQSIQADTTSIYMPIEVIHSLVRQSLSNVNPQQEVITHITKEDSVYICFTSGSSGMPKGVLISHGALSNLVSGLQKYVQIDQSSRVIANTSIGFDVSIAEIWMTLTAGGQLILTGAQQPLTGTPLAQFLNRKDITHLAITPSVLGSIPFQFIPKLKNIVCAGETPSTSLVDLWAKDRQFFNAYGPTEATIYASISQCYPSTLVSIGLPLSNVLLEIVDANLLPIYGEGIGELCIGGAGLMKKYINVNSDDCFIELELINGDTQKMYRTGDAIKRHPDGSLEYLHRLDSQIKINGLRIELEEIEQTLSKMPHIADAVVCVDHVETHSILIAFVVLHRHDEVDWGALKESLAERLLPAMIPDQFIPIKSIPLTLAGKKDRKLLLSNYKRKKILRKNYCAPRNAIEYKLGVIWKKILSSEFDLSVAEEFKWLGGDSIAFLELICQIEAQFCIEVPPGFFGHYITIERLAIKIDELIWERNTHTQLPTDKFTASRIYKGLRDLTALWRGSRIHASSLIVSRGLASAQYDLFICLQNDDEFDEISKALGNNFRVHAMRSGHILMDYTPESIMQLAVHYVSELCEIKPLGKLLLGGICQGGSIATQMAKILPDHYCVELLLLIDQARLIPYAGKIAFIYSGNGPLNPYHRFANDLSRYDKLYGEHYSISLVPCEHGAIHVPPHSLLLSHAINSLLSPKHHSVDASSPGYLQKLVSPLSAVQERTFQNAYQQWHFEKSSLTDLELIAQSGLFDGHYYQQQVEELCIEPKNLLSHFTQFGWKDDLNPSALFNTLDYQQRYPEVLSEETNPLVHYLRKGMYQGKIPWNDKNLLAWQGPIHRQLQLALDVITKSPFEWITLSTQQKVYIYAHSRGHFVFRQFQELIAQAFTEIGVLTKIVDERSPIDRSKEVVSIVVGAHEFFYLRGAKDPREFDFEKLIIFNSEQLNSYWFAKIMPILKRARFILDINLQTAASLVNLGMNARFLPLGFVPKNELFQPILPDQGPFKYKLDVAIPIDDTSSQFFSLKRNIDLLWVGSNSERRNHFWQENRPLFDSMHAIVRLLKYEGPLGTDKPNAVLPQTFLTLSHRAKIALNIHRFDTPYFEWQRLMHYGFFQGCCVVTESSSQIPGLIPNIHYFEDEISQLPSLIGWLINDPDGQAKLEGVRRAGYEAAMQQYQLSQSLRDLFDIGTTSRLDRS